MRTARVELPMYRLPIMNPVLTGYAMRVAWDGNRFHRTWPPVPWAIAYEKMWVGTRTR